MHCPEDWNKYYNQPPSDNYDSKNVQQGHCAAQIQQNLTADHKWLTGTNSAMHMLPSSKKGGNFFTSKVNRSGIEYLKFYFAQCNKSNSFSYILSPSSSPSGNFDWGLPLQQFSFKGKKINSHVSSCDYNLS